MSTSKNRDWVELVDFWESFSSTDEDQDTCERCKLRDLNKSGYGAIFKQINRSQIHKTECESEICESSLITSPQSSCIVSATGGGDGAILKTMDEMPSCDIQDGGSSSSSSRITILATSDVGASCSLSSAGIADRSPVALDGRSQPTEPHSVQEIAIKTGAKLGSKKRFRIMRIIRNVCRPWRKR